MAIQIGPKNEFVPISFRVRVGVVASAGLLASDDLLAVTKAVFSNEIPRVFDQNSRNELFHAKFTEMAYSVLTTLHGPVERMVARMILGQNQGKFDVILPCPRTPFVKEFLDNSDCKDFLDLIQQSRRPITLNRVFRGSQLNKAEKSAYMQASLDETWRFIADSSDVLVVIHEEDAANASYVEIAKYAGTKGRPVISISAEAPYAVATNGGNGLNAKVIRGLEAFNSFAIDLQKEDEAITESYNRLFSQTAGISGSSKNDVRKHLSPFHFRAAQIASKNRKAHSLYGSLVYLLSSLAVAAVAAGALIPTIRIVASVLELFFLVTIVVTVLLAKKRQTHKNWIENRFLAERLRAAEFLAACETEVTHVRFPLSIRSGSQSEDWVLMAFNEIWERLPTWKRSSEADISELKNFIRDQWLMEQIDYHDRKALKSHRWSVRLERFGIIVFGVALLIAVFHLLITVFHPEWIPNIKITELALMFLAIVLPAVGAAISGFRSHREYSRLAKRSENIAQNLVEINNRLETATTRHEFESLLREAEGAIIDEAQDWLMLMRFTEIEAAA